MTAVPAIVGFARTLRSAGVAAGPERVHAWIGALRHLDASRMADVYWCGRVTLCSTPDDLHVYDQAFTAYFGARPPSPIRRQRAKTITVPVVSDDGATGDGEERDGQPAALAAASRHEVLRHRDVARLTADQRAEVNQLLARLAPTGPARRSRRRRPSHRAELDPHRTVRAMLRRGGEPARLLHRRQSVKTRRLVLLVDVSGSMSPYSDSLLRFAHAACRRRPSTEVFTIGTRLTRVSRQLRQPDADAALAAAGAAVPDWSGGTRLGEQLKAFLDRWGQRGTARGAVVVVASDGWERGDVTELATQMARLRRLAHRIVWVSPHAGKDGFAPEVRGLGAALPFCDRLVAGDSLASLHRLAALLSEGDLASRFGGRRADA